jgi:crotonobetainyl-CoA:carnitine CoA-transferase CaiB-like acyl-CoA transferase
MVAADIPGGPVHGVGEAVSAMTDIEADWVTTVDGVRLPASPIRVDGERLAIHRPPPRLGEHTDEILGLVGVSADDLKVLRRQRVIA